jgi:hypothetical protein
MACSCCSIFKAAIISCHLALFLSQIAMQEAMFAAARARSQTSAESAARAAAAYQAAAANQQLVSSAAEVAGAPQGQAPPPQQQQAMGLGEGMVVDDDLEEED